jgi:hypothetical protein
VRRHAIVVSQSKDIGDRAIDGRFHMTIDKTRISELFSSERGIEESGAYPPVGMI